MRFRHPSKIKYAGFFRDANDKKDEGEMIEAKNTETSV